MPVSKTHRPRPVSLPTGANGINRWLHINRCRLVPEPGVLALRELTGSIKNPLPRISLPITNGQRGCFRKNRVYFSKFCLFFLQPRQIHVIKPRRNAGTNDQSVNANDRIRRRRFDPLLVQPTQKSRKIESRPPNHDDRNVCRDPTDPFSRTSEPRSGRKFLGRRHHIDASHAELFDFVLRRLGRSDVHAPVDEHRVGRENARAHFTRKRRRNRALAARSRPRQQVGRPRHHRRIAHRSVSDSRSASRPRSKAAGLSRIVSENTLSDAEASSRFLNSRSTSG